MKDFRRLERTGLQVSKLKLDLIYFQKCLELEICPQFLKFRPPNLSAYKDIKKWYQKAVKNQISVIDRKLKDKKSSYSTLLERITGKVSVLEKAVLINGWSIFFKKETEKVVQTHDKKLKNLWILERCRSPDCLINLSKKELTGSEENVLRLGLKHHILPKEIKGEE